MPIPAFIVEEEEDSSSHMNPQRPVMELFDPDITGNGNYAFASKGLFDKTHLPARAPQTGSTQAQDIYFTLVVVCLGLGILFFIIYFLNKFFRYVKRVLEASENQVPAEEGHTTLPSPPPKSLRNTHDDDAPPQYDGPPPYDVAIRMSAIEDANVGSLNSKYVSSSIIV